MIRLNVYFIALIGLLSLTGCVTPSSVKDSPPQTEWWNVPYPASFDVTALKPQSVLAVKGNQFVDEAGNPVVLRGVNIADPDKLVRQGQWSKALFIELKAWGANVIRVPVHPVALRERGQGAYFDLIDQAVTWANENGLYLILDWHSIGYLPTEVFQHPMYLTSKAETYRFWRDVAARYKNVPTLAIYELFNEPTTWGGSFGKPNWAEWKAINEELIDIIWAVDKTVIPLVAGFNWAYDLSQVKLSPVAREGIAYAVHPYPQKENPNPPTEAYYHAAWQRSWGHLADTYPMVASELGWVSPDGYGAHVPVKNDGSYGPHIMSFLEGRKISWTVWCFDPEWAPTMIKNWQFEPTEQGAFFKQKMQEYNQ